MSQRDKFVKRLLEQGYVLAEKRRRYWIVKHESLERVLFLGSAGSLRVGRTYVTSIPVSDKFKQSLLA